MRATASKAISVVTARVAAPSGNPSTPRKSTTSRKAPLSTFDAFSESERDAFTTLTTWTAVDRVVTGAAVLMAWTSSAPSLRAFTDKVTARSSSSDASKGGKASQSLSSVMRTSSASPVIRGGSLYAAARMLIEVVLVNTPSEASTRNDPPM